MIDEKFVFFVFLSDIFNLFFYKHFYGSSRTLEDGAW